MFRVPACATLSGRNPLLIFPQKRASKKLNLVNSGNVGIPDLRTKITLIQSVLQSPRKLQNSF